MSAPIHRAGEVPSFLQGPPRRRLHLSGPATPPGFDQLLSGVPQAQQAWTTVENQLNAENAPQGIIYNAQQSFLGAYTGLAQTVPTLSTTDLLNVANAAGNLALGNSTILAAGNLMDGLVAGAVNGNPAEVVQAISGTFVAVAGAAVAAGSVSLGVGAAIVIGIALVTDFVDSLFQQSPPVATICGWNLSYQPNIIVNCAWTQGQIVQNGIGILGASGGGSTPGVNPFWRSFPNPTILPTSGGTPTAAATPASTSATTTIRSATPALGREASRSSGTRTTPRWVRSPPFGRAASPPTRGSQAILACAPSTLRFRSTTSSSATRTRSTLPPRCPTVAAP